MPEEMRLEATELSVTACEKFASNNEHAAKMIKEMMDKKFGPSFHVVVGEGYGLIIIFMEPFSHYNIRKNKHSLFLVVGIMVTTENIMVK